MVVSIIVIVVIVAAIFSLAFTMVVVRLTYFAASSWPRPEFKLCCEAQGNAPADPPPQKRLRAITDPSHARHPAPSRSRCG